MNIKLGNFRLTVTESIISLLVVFSLAYYPVSYAVNQLVNKFIQYGAWWDSAVCLGVYLIVVLLAVPYVLKRQTAFTVGILVVFIVTFCFTYLLEMDGARYAGQSAVAFFTRIFPFLFLGAAIGNFEELETKIEIATRVIICAAVVWNLIVVFDIYRNVRIPYMQISYYVLPSCLFRIYYAFQERSGKNVVFALLGVVCHVLWGTRGPILFVILFIVICLLRSSTSKTRIIIAISLTLVGVVLYIEKYEILSWASSVLAKYRLVNSGIIKMMSDDISDGRLDMFQQIWPYIKEHLLFGGGIYSDRMALEGYVHLLPLELICDFGVFFGTILFAVLTAAIVRRMVRINVFSDFRWALLWIAVITGYGKLFLSSSYLQEPFFFFLLGLLANRTMTDNYLLEGEANA